MTEELKPLDERVAVLHAFSRFNNQPLFIENNRYFFGTWQPINIPESPSDTFHTVTEADSDRIDLIAYQYYQTPELWWVIAEVNGLFFPFEDLEPGRILRIPSYITLTSFGLIR